ncbi:glycosyltransferase family 39 protein [uncultured Draconibacterium sp.]|uniref:glycosyltransferase family 39 protein n=1 Tax=uncultured Draconibacterium sp. TaxID=1573823 RepID=UPI002AA8E222|nr:glycosyltransferase family 39 protein [uncultured Draconibacterium sp.]
MKERIRSINLILFLFILLGFFLAVINFFHFRSLWTDEASLALNIVNKPVKELLKPLDYEQVAPIGFLVVEKAFSSIFGDTDWSLRIFPLLVFFPSVYLMYKLASTIFKNKSFALFAAAFFSLSYYPLYYSAEVKQYMVDVFICLSITLSTMLFAKTDGKKYWGVYALIGIISVWVSNISVILLFSAGLYFFYKNRKKKQNYFAVIKVVGSWAISFIIYYFLFVFKHPSQQFMVDFWSNANAFLPKNILSTEFYYSLYLKITELYSLLGYREYTIVFCVISLLGLRYLMTAKKEVIFIVLTPIIIHLLLSYFKFYPFHARLILYQYPLLIIIFLASIYQLFYLLKNRTQRLSLYLLILPLITNLIILHKNEFPFEKQEIKNSLIQINKEIKDGDKIYVYHRTFRAFSFYKSNYQELARLDKNNIIIGQSSINNWTKYNKVIKNINGNIWILFSHVYSHDGQNEESYIINLFQQNDFKIVEEHKYKGSSVYKVVKTDLND